MHILSAEQFSTDQLDSLFGRADELREQSRTIEERREVASFHIGSQLCSFFYEESTRTRISFEKAAQMLGMGVVSTTNARQFSSVSKGETIEDTFRVLDEYDFATIVLRSDEIGGAARAAAVCETPIINAGDGGGEHPTQAVLDAYTIKQKLGSLEDLHVVIGGDLAKGRTVRSLAQLISKYQGNRISFVSIPELQIGEDIKVKLEEDGTPYEETAEMYDALRTADVVYWTRLQKERLEHPDAVPKGGFVLDAVALEVMPKDAIIMHPLPRNAEIHPSVDVDPRAQYFRQAGNGLYVRMALIDQIVTAPQ